MNSEEPLCCDKEINLLLKRPHSWQNDLKIYFEDDEARGYKRTLCNLIEFFLNLIKILFKHYYSTFQYTKLRKKVTTLDILKNICYKMFPVNNVIFSVTAIFHKWCDDLVVERFSPINKILPFVLFIQFSFVFCYLQFLLSKSC